MTDLAQLSKNVNLGPVRSSISWTTAVGNVLNLSGPLLVALLCVLAGLLGFTTYASCGPNGLKDGILKRLSALGQTPRQVHFEHFEFA